MNLETKAIEAKRSKVVAVDLDGTLTEGAYIDNFWDITTLELGKHYLNAKPKIKIIKAVNSLYDKGYIICLFTSRWDLYKPQTKEWLQKNGVKYHELWMNKPFYDFILDDKSVELNRIDQIR